jgi:hypothetical protein
MYRTVSGFGSGCETDALRRDALCCLPYDPRRLKNNLGAGASFSLLPQALPGRQTTRPPFDGLPEVIQLPRESGAGEGIRTLDPDLGKVVLLFQRLAARDRSGL